MSEVNSALPAVGDVHGAFRATRATPGWLWDSDGSTAVAPTTPLVTIAQVPGRAAAAGLRADDVTLEIHSDLHAVEDEWRAFERVADATPFQSFSWASNWVRHVGERQGVRPIVALGRRPGGALLFILPLAIEPGRLKRLTWLGCALCDYGAPLLAPDFESTLAGTAFLGIWEELVTRLQSEPHTRADLVDLPKMPERVGAQANPFVALPTTENPSGAYVFDLTADWGDALRRQALLLGAQAGAQAVAAAFGERRHRLLAGQRCGPRRGDHAHALRAEVALLRQDGRRRPFRQTWLP